MWFDDNGKKAVAEKIREGAQAYAARFGVPPTVALVNESERADVEGLTVLTKGYIQRSNFWFGVEAPE